MSSSSATSQNSEHNDDQTVIDIRKRKRMLSNRESARRSRQRKQKQLDDLTTEMSQLRSQNGQILSTMSVTTQLYVNMEADNSVLRAQLSELTNRLNSLNEIIRCLSSPAANSTVITTAAAGSEEHESFGNGSFENCLEMDDCFSMSSFGGWGFDQFPTHPIMSAPDAFMC